MSPQTIRERPPQISLYAALHPVTAVSLSGSLLFGQSRSQPLCAEQPIKRNARYIQFACGINQTSAIAQQCELNGYSLGRLPSLSERNRLEVCIVTQFKISGRDLPALRHHDCTPHAIARLVYITWPSLVVDRSSRIR
jgi:hypothetical protein